MTTRERTLLLLVTVAAAVAMTFGWTQHWHYWPTPLVAPIIVLITLTGGRTRRTDGVNATVEPPPTPAAAQHFREAFDRDTAVANVPVPTASANYEFLFSATIHWRPSPTAPHEVTIVARR